MAEQEILDAIPQRPPFLFLDRIVEVDKTTAVTEKTFLNSEPFFEGHFPGNPVVPGVILQEACFQTGAVLVGKQDGAGLGVITKVENARFKRIVRPNELLTIQVELQDHIANAFYMKGKISIDGKAVMSVQFTCAAIEA